MGKIAIVTDSTADLPPDKLDKYDIHMVSLQVDIQGKKYWDWKEIGPEKFLTKLDDCQEIPSTSQPPIGNFVDLYQELAADYKGIVSIHFSSEMSGTLETAKLAADMVEKTEIEVIDSRLVTGPLGLMVEEAAQAAQAGSTMEEIKDLVAQLRDRIDIYFTMDDLNYLERGGRIGRATAFLGNLFTVRPMLTLEAGEITPCKKVRGEKKLYKEFNRLVGQSLTGEKGNRLIILYGKYRDKAEKLKETLISEYEWETVEMWQFGAIVGAHIGPTPFGAVFLD